jgi:dUTP pyrophosphatase
MKIYVQRLNNNAKLPVRAYPTDSGADIFYCGEEKVLLPSHTTKVFPTGIAVKLLKHPNPEMTYELQVRSKSGLAAKHNLFVLNSPGTVDNSYTGEIKVILHNSSENNIEIQPNQKIAQLVMCEVCLPEFEEIEDIENLGKSERGQNGFGSTGH